VETDRVSYVQEAITAPFHALISKQAQRAYLGTLLFVITSFFLFATAAVAYWVFYFNYVPQIGLERVVHLQFGCVMDNSSARWSWGVMESMFWKRRLMRQDHSAENPWGTAFLGSELASLQPYDVSVTLQLPRTPANVAAGNFMLDLAFLSRPQSSIMGTNSSTSVITHSRRPAILTYASPLVDTAHKISRMPLYLVGWQREAETLEVKMMESVEFARGWRNVPGSLRFEMQSQEQMQVYSAIVKFKAKFTGLR
jgi:seipin